MEVYNDLFIINKELEIIDSTLDLLDLKNEKKGIDDLIKNKKILEERKKELLTKIHSISNTNDLSNQLLYGDCLEYLPKIKSNSVELVLSDIPYGINLDEWDVLHNNTNSALLGSSPAQKEKGSGFKRRGKPINGWSEDDKKNSKYYEDWCYKWAQMLYPVVKEAAPVLIFGGRRTMHAAISAFEKAGFLVKDILVWKKEAAHHRSQDIFKVLARRGSFKITDDTLLKLENTLEDTIIIKEWIEKLRNLKDINFNSSKVFLNEVGSIDEDMKKKYTYEILDYSVADKEVRELIDKWKGWKLGNLAPIYEPIIWMFKPYTTVTLTDAFILNGVGAMNVDLCKINGKMPTNVLEFGFSKEESKNKLHDAQKPLELIEYLIKLFTVEGQTVLDPFVGSGTTAVAAKKLGRKYIAIERELVHYNTAKKRLE